MTQFKVEDVTEVPYHSRSTGLTAALRAMLPMQRLEVNRKNGQTLMQVRSSITSIIGYVRATEPSKIFVTRTINGSIYIYRLPNEEGK